MITVKFESVGRDKKSWEKQYTAITEEGIAKEAKRGGGLMSREVWVDFNETATVGTIFAGCREVGKISVS